MANVVDEVSFQFDDFARRIDADDRPRFEVANGD